jgi:hypothetical protein
MEKKQVTQKIKTSMIPSRILICGLGSIGRRHLQLLRHMWPHLEIAIFRSGYGPPFQQTNLANYIFTSFEEALTWNPQAAIITSPATDHLEKSLALARKKIPLLIEKPIGVGSEKPDEWQELLNLSKIVPIEIAYIFRHNPCTYYIKKQLSSGTLGKLLEADFYCGSWLPSWRPGLDYRKCVSARHDLGGGAMLEISHEIDLAHWLFGDIRLQSSSIRSSGLLEIDVEDQAFLTGTTRCGIFISIRLNFCTQPPKRKLIVRGSTGEIEWDLLNDSVKQTRTDPDFFELFTSPISLDTCYENQAKSFMESAAGMSSPICSVAEGLKVLNFIERARKIADQ